MTITITAEAAHTEDAQLLIAELDGILAPHYPDESRHGYSVDKLIAQGVAFFIIRAAGVPAACGGVQIVGAEYGELKRMYVRPQFQGVGLAKIMLDHLTGYARGQKIEVLRLETGIYQHEAIGLYEKWGFSPIPPFGPYQPDPNSLFYEKRIA